MKPGRWTTLALALGAASACRSAVDPPVDVAPEPLEVGAVAEAAAGEGSGEARVFDGDFQFAIAGMRRINGAL